MTKRDVSKVAVVGLGYVGLPLAAALAKKIPVLGIDVNQKRVAGLKEGYDINNEMNPDDLKNTNLTFTTDFSELKEHNFIIVAVPTPVDKNKKPDLIFLEKSSESIGKNMAKGTIVVYESTVYPGVTEDVCAKVLETYSGMKCGVDFNIGYSPERINPGDTVHTVDKITKIVSGDNEDTLETIAEVYSRVVEPGVFKASNIKTAEMAKVIENTQRDINIALLNEIALICEKIGIRTQDVLDATRTKWNALPFFPGLVGGHCIGVDPYYLTYKCEELNYHPQMILSGRRINDSMPKYVAEMAVKNLIHSEKVVKGANILILGVTFKENVKDIRNSKIYDMMLELKDFGLNVFLHDPLAEEEHVEEEFGTHLIKIEAMKNIDCVIYAVSHNEYKALDWKNIRALCNDNPVFMDIKSVMKKKQIEDLGFRYWSL
ncbi:MAG: nucleotide sugar dehydrogenase [Candidatus Sericytochromatia bacterium]